ncbi:hypothetical protein COOONC_19266, partial [Cooperia oncophora]
MRLEDRRDNDFDEKKTRGGGHQCRLPVERCPPQTALMSPGVGTVSVLLGAQWGDEGKGKVIDYLIENND